MLAAPPADIVKENPSRGLDPSVYGGGGSDSSTPFLADDSPFVSCGSAALTSTSAADGALDDSTIESSCTIGEKVGRAAGSGSVTRCFGCRDCAGNREEKVGGRRGLEDEGAAGLE